MKLIVKFAEEENRIKVDLNESPTLLNCEFKDLQAYYAKDYYEGDYSIIPKNYQQVIPIEELTAKEDIVVEAIPSNYGLITWNGSSLMVS